MVQIEGTYELTKNENFVEYLKALGTEMTDDIVKRLEASRSTVRVKLDGEKCTFYTGAADGTESALTFTFDQSFVDEISPGVELTTTSTFDGTNINLKSETADGRGGNRRYEFTDSGLIIHYTTNGSDISARRIYDRI